MKEVSSRIYRTEKGKLATQNLVPGISVYGEVLTKEDGIELREWDPKRSKLASAIIKGIKVTGIQEGNIMLYLGAASGTTVSHMSDIVGKKGFVFAVEFAPSVLRRLVYVAEQRKNIAPILADANKPQTYLSYVTAVDVVYQDVAQKNQVEIFQKNIDLFLKKGGYALLALKARSIDVAKQPKKIFAEVKAELEKNLEIVDYRILDPFERDHAFFVCRKR
jgi:fibrillarin-like pre-rRNA processing protein